MKTLEGILVALFAVTQFLIFSILAAWSLAGWWYVFNISTDDYADNVEKAWMFGIKAFGIFGIIIPVFSIGIAMAIDADMGKFGGNCLPYVVGFILTCIVGFIIRLCAKEN